MRREISGISSVEGKGEMHKTRGSKLRRSKGCDVKHELLRGEKAALKAQMKMQAAGTHAKEWS